MKDDRAGLGDEDHSLAHEDQGRQCARSLALSRSHTRRIWRAIVEFQMISEGDRILVGFSGGKDSAFLLYALAAIREYSPIEFALAAGHVDMGYGQQEEVEASERLAEFAGKLGVPYLKRATNIAKVAFGASHKENPCAICSHLRRGALNNLALENGFNKVALAHHRDDVVETLLMSILYSGQIHTFRPVTFLDRTGITVIRPLVYFREREVAGTIRRIGYDVPPNACPMEGASHRAKVKRLIRELTRENPIVYDNLFKAIHSDAIKDLWPPVATDQEMRDRHKAIFGKLRRVDPPARG
ncbi:MAG: tRNA 2-thiocytidine biosynthesis protein TtcA [Firmicutes bacterium]|jgi:tRNA(Ile)-lysidine synthase TilS/MesJ|nr:tRNA 2-thiocytidine biosynthesis protein TtcA [Bacillota bacterium]MDH7496285.1 ATP-binding protein [Bacillota bacterium]